MLALETSKPHYARQLLAELVGTGFLVIVAAGGDVIDVVSGGEIGHVARYLAPGLIVVAMIWSLSGISGAHINPAVTLAFVLRGVFPPLKAVGYWIAQFAGGIIGAMLLRAFFGRAVINGVTHPGSQITAAAVGWESQGRRDKYLRQASCSVDAGTQYCWGLSPKRRDYHGARSRRPAGT